MRSFIAIIILSGGFLLGINYLLSPALVTSPGPQTSAPPHREPVRAVTAERVTSPVTTLQESMPFHLINRLADTSTTQAPHAPQSAPSAVAAPAAPAAAPAITAPFAATTPEQSTATETVPVASARFDITPVTQSENSPMAGNAMPLPAPAPEAVRIGLTEAESEAGEELAAPVEEASPRTSAPRRRLQTSARKAPDPREVRSLFTNPLGSY